MPCACGALAVPDASGRPGMGACACDTMEPRPVPGSDLAEAVPGDLPVGSDADPDEPAAAPAPLVEACPETDGLGSGGGPSVASRSRAMAVMRSRSEV